MKFSFCTHKERKLYEIRQNWWSAANDEMRNYSHFIIYYTFFHKPMNQSQTAIQTANFIAHSPQIIPQIIFKLDYKSLLSSNNQKLKQKSFNDN